MSKKTVATPNDPKLSHGRSWRGTCVAVVAAWWVAGACAVTAEPVGCSAWLGVADPSGKIPKCDTVTADMEGWATGIATSSLHGLSDSLAAPGQQPLLEPHDSEDKTAQHTQPEHRLVLGQECSQSKGD